MTQVSWTPFVVFFTGITANLMPTIYSYNTSHQNVGQQKSTDVVYIEDTYPEYRTYKVEDFFWTGSGDGSSENPWEDNSKTSTIYKTKTVLSTVYISVTNDDYNQTSTSSITETADNEVTDIHPTPTLDNSTSVIPTVGNVTTDKYFWLLTVIKTDQQPVIAVLEKRLAKLYSVAFRRQQERHLGISKRMKRQTQAKPVNVCIHALEKNAKTDEVEVLYHVLVAGKPVAATTAAADMKRFVSDEEVAHELGFPVRTKAEPYIKPQNAEKLARTNDTWLFIGVALSTIFILVIIVTIFTLCLNKTKKPNARPTGIINRQQIFHKENETDNQRTYQSGKRYHRRLTNKSKVTTSNETLNSRLPRPSSTESSCSSSSSSSAFSSPILSKNKRPPIAINKTLLLKQAAIGIESETNDKQTVDGILLPDNDNREKLSPKSYLSMPSMKNFPRSCVPETLNKILEPVSVLHLDLPDDFDSEEPAEHLARTGSMNDAQDPGVLNPVIWGLHCKRLKNVQNETDNNVTKMRKRLNELLDDTFSLFGTSKEEKDSLESGNKSNNIKRVAPRGKSATIRNTSEIDSSVSKPRPKTSDSRKKISPSPGAEPPRGAWSSATPSPLVRPQSAGVFPVPVVEIDRILVDTKLKPQDPAVPLIAAIKNEIKKYSLPGSASHLADI